MTTVIILIAALVGWYLWENYIPREHKEKIKSPIERRLYLALRHAGFNPIPQFPSCGYWLDLVIIDKGKMLDIECDGKDYHSSEEQKKHDRARTRVLRKAGWEVIRFSGYQIYKYPDKCVRKIKAHFNETFLPRRFRRLG